MSSAGVMLSTLCKGILDGPDGPMATRPYWWDAAPPSSEQTEPPREVDVAIVGSGFTGLSAALTLLRRGRSVAVFDRGVPGFGASTRNGGQVGSGNQKFRVRTLIEMRGEANAVALLREGIAMLDHIEQLVTSEHIDCHFSRCGRFRGAMRPEHYDSMARDLDDLRRYVGVESVVVPRAEQHREIASDLFHGGTVLPNDAALHPGLYHAGLLRRVEGAGGLVLGLTPVESISADRSGFRMQTPRGEVVARDVIVATNGYTQKVHDHLDRRIVPVGSAVIATEPLPPGLIQELMPGGRMYGNTNRVFFYFRAAPDQDRIVWGGRVGRGFAADSPFASAHLARDMRRTFPQLGDVRVTHGWSGQIGYTFDSLPHLGRTPDGIHYAMGYCGTGVSRSTWFGHKIALKLIGDPEGASAFDDIVFPTHPFHAVAPAMVPVYEAWYRMRDALDF